MDEYVLFVNPDWWEEAKKDMPVAVIKDGFGFSSYLYSGMPVISDKWLPNPPGYVIAKKNGFGYLPIPNYIGEEDGR